MEELLSNWQYDQKNMPKDKKSSESFNEYPTLIERIDKLQRQIQNAEKICLLPIWFPNNRAADTMYEQQKKINQR